MDSIRGDSPQTPEAYNELGSAKESEPTSFEGFNQQELAQGSNSSSSSLAQGPIITTATTTIKDRARLSSSNEDDDQGCISSKKKKVNVQQQQQNEDEVIDLLDSDADENDAAAYAEDTSDDDNLEWDSDNWEGPPDAVPDETVFAVLRACPHGATNGAVALHSSEHVRVIAIFSSKEKADKRADGIRSRLDVGGEGDGMVPGGTGWEDEVNIWVQEVPFFRK